MDHVFAVSAYKESPYLEECLESLKKQREESPVIVCTSTPCDFIFQAAANHGYRVFVREGQSSLKDDWNFAIDCAISELGAQFVTVAHQDDIYEPEYSLSLKKAFDLYPDMLIFCTRVKTIDKDGLVADSRAENVKRLLRMGIRMRKIAHIKIIKRSALVFGNAICAPSITYNIKVTGVPVFKDSGEFVTDWKALLRLSDLKGRFVCLEKELLRYRVHEGAQTKKVINDNTRALEERSVYENLWPHPIALILENMMKLAYGAYE